MYHMDNPHYTLSNRTTNIAQQNQVNALNVLQWHLRQLSEKKQIPTHCILFTIASTRKFTVCCCLVDSWAPRLGFGTVPTRLNKVVLITHQRWPIVLKKRTSDLNFLALLFVVRLADTTKPPSPQNHDYNNNLKLKMKCIAL
uniref:Uncharacterized protein n=1 Tax=Glossina pallidipes TaxID=7398 RepID=A0A1B0AE74_GLOPL